MAVLAVAHHAVRHAEDPLPQVKLMRALVQQHAAAFACPRRTPCLLYTSKECDLRRAKFSRTDIRFAKMQKTKIDLEGAVYLAGLLGAVVN